MAVLREIDKNQYEDFVLKHNSLFHSLAWGELSKAYNMLTPHYLGYIDGTNIIGACMLLQKKIDDIYSYFYIIDDIIVSANNRKTMFSKILNYIRKNKGIYVDLFTTNSLQLKEVKPKESPSLPTHYSNINNFDEIYNTLNNKIKKENFIAIETYKGSKKDLIHLSLANSIKYYETINEIFNTNKSTTASVFVEKLHISTTVNNLEKRLKDINTQISIMPIDSLTDTSKKKYTLLEEQKMEIVNKLKTFKGLKQKYKNDIVIYANLLIEYGNTAWILYDTKKDILKEDITSYSTILEEIKYCKNKNIERIILPININSSLTKEKHCYRFITNYILYMLKANKLK